MADTDLGTEIVHEANKIKVPVLTVYKPVWWEEETR